VERAINNNGMALTLLLRFSFLCVWSSLYRIR